MSGGVSFDALPTDFRHDPLFDENCRIAAINAKILQVICCY